MKMRKRTTKVTVETERTLIFRSREDKHSGWCTVCGAQAEMLTLEAAARTAGLSERTVCRLVEAGSVHFIEDAAGHLLLCPNSLLGCA